MNGRNTHIMASVAEVAAAMCVTSHHGLTRTDWPCPYHLERARKVAAHLNGKPVLASAGARGESPVGSLPKEEG